MKEKLEKMVVECEKKYLLLEHKCRSYENALFNWYEWEQKQIEKEGEYVGQDIRKLIKEAGRVLKKYRGEKC